MHRNSTLVFERFARPYFKSGMRILEIGPDGFPSTYGRLVDALGLVWESVDIADRPGLTYTATGEESFPIPDGRFDIVLSGQVIEHVRKPWRWIREAARVCASGGHLINIVPVSWPYHEAPVDCWRVHPEGMRSLHEEAGLETVLAQSICLELESGARITPGRSAGEAHGGGKAIRLLRRLLRRPTEAAIDTIAIARKA